MPLAFLFDENVPRSVLGAARSHNLQSQHVIDLVAVGEPDDLPRGTDDPTILLWAERENRIVVTLDMNTMPGFFAKHLDGAIICPVCSFSGREARHLTSSFTFALIAHASAAWEWQDRYCCIPY